MGVGEGYGFAFCGNLPAGAHESEDVLGASPVGIVRLAADGVEIFFVVFVAVMLLSNSKTDPPTAEDVLVDLDS